MLDVNIRTVRNVREKSIERLLTASRKFLEILLSLLGYILREGVCYVLAITLAPACFIPGMFVVERFNLETVFGIDVWLLYCFIVLPAIFWIVYGVPGDFMKRLLRLASDFLLCRRPEKTEAVLVDENRKRL